MVLPIRHLIVQIQQFNIKKMCEICSKLKAKTPERRHRRHSGFFIVKFEQISHIPLELSLLTLNNLLQPTW